MSISVTAPRFDERAWVNRVLQSGAIAGVLDAVFAVALYVFVLGKLSLLQVLQYIASGLLGQSAFAGGWATGALGAAIHFVIAWAWAYVFWAARARSTSLRRQTRTRAGQLAVGALFGALVWIIMDLAVLPLSGAAPTPPSSPLFFVFLVEHALLVGWPIALLIY